MTTPTVQVRARWLNGRTEALDPMPPEVATQEIQGQGDDGRWYSFRHAGEIDADGFLVFDQAPDAIDMSPGSPSGLVELSAQCLKCGQALTIHCKTNYGFSAMLPHVIVCPRCSKVSEIPVPGEVLDVITVGA